MNLNKIILQAAAALLLTGGLAGCKADEYWDKADLAPGAVTADISTFTATFRPGDEIPSPTFTLPIRRGTASGDETVALKAFEEDSQGKYTIPVDPAVWQVPAGVTIKNGQNESTIPVTLLARELGTYKLKVQLADPNNVAVGGSGEWIVSATIQGATPDPVWKSLGQGTYVNSFFFENKYQVEVQRDDAEFAEDQLGYYGHYRLIEPMTQGFAEEGYEVTEPVKEIEFYVIPPGEKIPKTEITVPADSKQSYVYIKSHNIGYIDSDYGAEVWAMYGANLTGSTLADFAGQIVLGWKAAPSASNPKGELGAISMGCYYYMQGIGGWNNLKDTKQFQFIFPGFSLGDYSFNLAYGGHFIDAEKKEYIVGDVTWESKDIDHVYMGLVNTTDGSEAIQTVIKSIDAPEGTTDVVSVEKLTKSGSAKFAVAQSGTYTLAAISCSKDGELQEASTATVKFTSINDMGGDPNWEKVGVGEYTDDILTAIFEDLDPAKLIYEVTVERNKQNTALYRIKDPYGKGVYPYTLTDMTTVDDYMELDATNPKVVKMNPYALGKINGLGTLNVLSFSYYLAQNGKSDEEIAATGKAGILQLGEITFPAKGLLWTVPDNADYSSLYYTNIDGNFKLSIPDANAMTVKKAHKAVKSTGLKAGALKKVNARRANLGIFGKPSAAFGSQKVNATRGDLKRVPMLMW